MTVTVVSRRANFSRPPAALLKESQTKGHGVHEDDLQLSKNLEHVIIQTRSTLQRPHSIHLLRKPRVKRLSNLLRLTDTTALDDYVVKLLQLGKTDELLEQVAAEGAADASVLEGDDLFLGLGEVVGLLDEGGIDVDAVDCQLKV